MHFRGGVAFGRRRERADRLSVWRSWPRLVRRSAYVHHVAKEETSRHTFLANNILLAVIFGVGVASFVLTANDGDHGPNSGSYMSVGGMVQLAIAGFSFACAVRCLLAGAYVSDSGVRVRNIFRTKTFEWNQIAAFEVRPNRTSNWRAAAVVPKVGRAVRATTLSPTSRLGRNPLARVDETVTELNQLLTTHSGVEVVPGPEPVTPARRQLLRRC